jgi:hypothetical protein
MDFTTHWTGLLALGLFVTSYGFVVLEDVLEIRKSKPVLMAAGLIWALVAVAYGTVSRSENALELARHSIEEYGELFLFLFAAITYVHALEERRVFDFLRARLVKSGFGYRQLFWLTGALALPGRYYGRVSCALSYCRIPLAFSSRPMRAISNSPSFSAAALVCTELRPKWRSWGCGIPAPSTKHASTTASNSIAASASLNTASSPLPTGAGVKTLPSITAIQPTR